MPCAHGHQTFVNGCEECIALANHNLYDDDRLAVTYLESLEANLYGDRDDQDAIEQAAERIVTDTALRRYAAEREQSSVDRFMEALGHYWSLPSSPPTKHQDRIGWRVLSDVCLRVRTALEEDGPLPVRPVFGTIPLGYPCGLLVCVPRSSHSLILIDDHLPTFANLIAKAYAQALPLSQDGGGVDLQPDWAAGLTSGHPAVMRFLELLDAAAFGVPSAVPSYLPDSRWDTTSSVLRLGIESFVLAEPYAHIRAGHLDASEIVSLPHIAPSVRGHRFSDEQRLEAFLLQVATVASVADHERHDQRMAYWGVEVFLDTLVMIDRVRRFRDSYPPPEDGGCSEEKRRLKLRQVLLALGRQDVIALMDAMRPITRAFSAHVDCVFMARPNSGEA